MLELSRSSQADSSHGDGEETEISKLRGALDDLQAQNTMLQDELTLLSNVKGELEADMDRAKEDFQMEKEELEFKINELQMTKDGGASTEVVTTTNPEQQDQHGELKEPLINLAQDQNSQYIEEQQKLSQEMRIQCEALIIERDAALAECHHLRDIHRSVETELGEKMQDFVEQYQAMKEQGANTVQDLQDEIKELTQERDELLARMSEVAEEKNVLIENLKDLKQKLEGSPFESQTLLSSVEEQATLAFELKQSVEDLTRQNEKILSELEMKENMIHDLKETVDALNGERDKAQHLLKLKEEEMQNLSNDKQKELERVMQEERERVEESLKDKLVIGEERLSTLELNMKELATEKTALHQKLEDSLSELCKSQEEREMLASKMAALEAQLQQGASEKQLLEAKLTSLTEDAEKALASRRALEENQTEVLKKSTEEIEELRTRVNELEKERSHLKSSLDEAQVEKGSEEMKDLQAHMVNLEKERNVLRANLEEVANGTELMQKDLQNKKSVNEKISEENQRLQAEMSLLPEKEEEMERKIENMQKESRELREQLTEKESLISQLQSEMAAFQVGGAPMSLYFMSVRI